jgi:hypothetical protein
MTADTGTARDDLAFMRALVQDGATGMTAALGEAYFAGGLIYGLQCLIQSSSALGAPPLPASWQLVAGLGPTVVFSVAISIIIWRHRNDSKGGFVGRAVGAAFACLSVSNLALILVIGSLALARHSLEIWLLYPCAVFVMQGASWLIAYALRQRPWLLFVGLGWYAAAVALAFSISLSVTAFGLLAGASLILLMAAPGLAIMRLARNPG